MSETTVFHLLGHPGVGKLTVARALAARAKAQGTRLIVVDNHLTSLPILAVLDHDGSSALPEGTWELVGEIRDRVHRAICELAPPDRSFVFTNVVVESDPRGQRTIERVRAVARSRDARYVPVLLTCERAEHRRRIAASGREERHKWTDPDAVDAFVERERLVRPETFMLELDVTALDPEAAAGTILATADRPVRSSPLQS